MKYLPFLTLLFVGICKSKLRYDKGVVVFSATKSMHQNSRNNRNVTFDSCHVNVGNGYDVNRGVFMAPTNGLYMFHYNALTGDDNRRFVVGLYRNRDVIVTAYARETRWWAMGGNSVILELHKADVVGLKFMYGENDMWGSRNERYATFNGHLLAAANRR